MLITFIEKKKQKKLHFIFKILDIVNGEVYTAERVFPNMYASLCIGKLLCIEQP